MQSHHKRAVSSALWGAIVVVVLVVAGAGGYLAGSSSSGGTPRTVTSTVTTAGSGGAVTVTTTVTGSAAVTSAPVTGNASQADVVALAKAEGGALTVYTITDPTTFTQYYQGNFTKLYPWAKINGVFLDPASTISRPTAEFKAGKVAADVIYAGSLSRQFIDVQNGVCAPVDLSSYLQLLGYPQGTYDTAGKWYANFVSLYVIIYNTNLVSPSQVPRSFADLANPMWKGKIAIDNPSTLGSSGLALAALYPSMGNQSWTQFMNGLAANQPSLQASGGTVETLVTQGQYAIGIDTLNGAINNIAKGLPIKVAWTSQVPSGLSGFCIAAGAPHPHMAQLFAEWLMGIPGQLSSVQSGHTSPLPYINAAESAGIPGNVTISSDVTKTDFYANPNRWAAVFMSLLGK